MPCLLTGKMNKKQCNNCLKFFNKTMRHCPFCGAENKRDIINTIQICLRCKCETQKYVYRKTGLDMRPACKGLWFDFLDFKKLTSERDVYADEPIPFEYIGKSFQEEHEYLSCPRCNSLMTRKNFRHISDISIDTL